MATKLDLEKKLFLGKVAVRENTTFGQIRKIVHDLNNGEGVSYAELEAHMLANYTPGKSKNYDGSFVKSYVRDAVNKFDYLSHEDLGVAYEPLVPAAKAEKAPKEAKPKPITKAEQAKTDMLVLIRDKGEISDVSEIDDSKVDLDTLVTETKRKQKTLRTQLETMEKESLVRVEQVENSFYVFLTPAGLTRANGVTDPATTGETAEQATAETPAAEDSDEA